MERQQLDAVSPGTAPAGPRPSSSTFVFADLAGYTALTEAHGDEQAADAAAEFCAHVRGLLPEHGGEEVKAIGDALLVRLADAVQAVRLAQRIVCGYGARHRALGVRVGMHTGTAVRRNGDWFGSGVNLAARVADVARAGEVLLTEQTRLAVGGALPVRRRGRRAFKNVAQPVELYELVVGEAASAVLPIDPVCRMAVDPSLAEGHEVYRGVEYHFCSARCQEAFRADPARHTRRRSAREHLLVTDDAREFTVARLRRAYRRGRLTEEELEGRVERAYAARTRGELATVTHDLPRPYRRRSAVLLFVRWLTRPVRRGWRRRNPPPRART